MAAAAAMLLQQNGISLPFDRSSSLRYPPAAAWQKKQALPRSSSSRARSLTDPLVPPQQLVNQYQLTEVLEAVLNESVDLENIPIQEVFENLRCSPEGLTSQAAEERLVIFGHNKLEEKKESKFLKFLGFMWNPLSWVMEAAAIMAIALANGGGKPPDWQDFVGIITLLVINSTISFIEENNAGNAAAALMARLAPKAKVLRNGKWNEEDAAVLVPGDIISIKLGDIVPADARLLEGDPLKIDQSALTGESLPVTKGPGDCVYSGSTCKQGD